ncbi:hypothetical protein J2X72_003931 [Phyllobacterium sp. 1468]|uniref:AAA family ATPase n=1 Tax=Phyllobacterium sp. 1468 TaxID=2817759 RepID=UPI00286127D9|nr:AAA family ATPase [Phyllobacterium sp. 1468]MDR6635119.1 hypothetical protein [Phyllobacterium sp. 1468]
MTDTQHTIVPGSTVMSSWLGEGHVDSIDGSIAQVSFAGGTRSHAIAGLTLKTERKSTAQPKESFNIRAPIVAHDNEPKAKIKVTQFKLRGTSRIPLRKFVYGNHLIRKYMSAMFAAGGLGKTSLISTEVLAMVTGRPLLGVKAERPLNVWFVNTEDPLDEIERKIEATAAHFGITEEDIGDRLFLSTGRDSDFVVAVDDKKGVLIVEPVVEEIVEHVTANKIDVIIVDPFVSTHGVNENDNMAIQKVAKVWVDIADKLDIAIELAHHVTKGNNEVTEDSGRGAGALKDKARAVRALNRMTPEQATKWGIPREDMSSYFRADMVKANLGKSGGFSEWYRFVSVPMENGEGIDKPQDFTGVVERWTPPSSEDTEALKTEREKAQRDELVKNVPADLLCGLKTRLANSAYRYDWQSTLWAGHLVAELFGMDSGDKGDKQKIKTMLQAWLDDCELQIVMLQDDRRNMRKHIKPA